MTLHVHCNVLSELTAMPVGEKFRSTASWLVARLQPNCLAVLLFSLWHLGTLQFYQECSSPISTVKADSQGLFWHLLTKLQSNWWLWRVVLAFFGAHSWISNTLRRTKKETVVLCSAFDFGEMTLTKQSACSILEPRHFQQHSYEIRFLQTSLCSRRWFLKKIQISQIIARLCIWKPSFT